MEQTFEVVPINLKSNTLALNNSAYLSSKRWKDPTKTIHIKIKDKYIKCKFIDEIPPDNIGMSKNLREFLQLDTVHPVLVELISKVDESKLYLKNLTIEISVRAKEANTDVRYHEETFINSVKSKENKTFLNHGQSFYVYLDYVTYLCTVKSLQQQKKSKQFGVLYEGTNINILLHPQETNIKGQTQSSDKGIFKKGFHATDMGIGGLDEEIKEIFRRAFVSRRFDNTVVDRFGVKHVKGILLYGPPGTGKTLIARQLAKALDIDERNFKKVDGPEIFSKYVGKSQENIRNLFTRAREDEKSLGPKSPFHVIVFDEIDAICKQRGMHSQSKVNDTVVNQLLSYIDGVDALNNILLIGMTNRKDLLDEAILRPGRFQIHIEVKLPNQAGRQQIFNIHTAKLQQHKLLDEKCKIEEISRITKNYTGAQIESVVKAAVSHTIMRNTNILNFAEDLKIDEKNLKLQLSDFFKAVDEIKPQFGVDNDKFDINIKEQPIDYGETFASINAKLDEKTYIPEDTYIQLKSVLLHGPIGSGKTTFAMNFAKRKNFPYTKIISPFNMVGLSETDKIKEINQVFENAYKTSRACIIINNLERLISYTSSIPSLLSFSNSVLQALMILIKKIPPNQNCKLLIIGITSLNDALALKELQFDNTFQSFIQVPKLDARAIETILVSKFKVNEGSAKKISREIDELTFQQLLDTAGLIEQKRMNEIEEWTETYNQLIQGNRQIFT